MSRWLLALLALPTAPACDVATPGCADRGAAYARLDPFTDAGDVPPDGARAGRFLRWTIEGALFAADDGASYGVRFDTEPEAVLPDPSGAGLVVLQTLGFEGSGSTPAAPVLAVRSASDRGRLLAALGNAEWQAPDLPIAVRAPRDMDTCTAWAHENGVGRNKPVAIEAFGEQATLFQGEEREVGGLVATVLAAQSNNRAHPSAPCASADCPWEKLAWTLRDPALPTLGPPPADDEG